MKAEAKLNHLPVASKLPALSGFGCAVAVSHADFMVQQYVHSASQTCKEVYSAVKVQN